MTAGTQTRNQKQTDIGYETSKFVLGTGIVMAALIGLWGVVCLISALAGEGPVNVVKGYLGALLG
jgi:hypothetical protein